MKDLVIGFCLFLSVVILGTIVSPRIGTSWDEPDNIHAGGIYAKFFTKGLDPAILIDRNATASVWFDKIFTQEPSLSRYPPVPIFVGVVVVRLWEAIKQTPATAIEIITAFHIASSVFMGIFVASLYALIRKISIPVRSAVAASILAGMHPTILGYGMSNIKDSALLSLFTLSLMLLVSSTKTGKRRYFVAGAVVWGLAMATKINAIYVPVIWLGWKFMYDVLNEMVEAKGLGKKMQEVGIRIVRMVGSAALLGSIGLVVMIMAWPYLWFDPVTRILEVLRYFTTVGTGYKVFWNQEVFMVGAGTPLPWYPITHIVLGTPLTYLVLASIGFVGLIVRGVYGVLKGKIRIKKVHNTSSLESELDDTKGLHTETSRGVDELWQVGKGKEIWSILALLGLWLLVPLVRTLSPTASFYDGMRHFLEILPPLFILLACGFEIITYLVHRFSDGRGVKFATILMIICLTHITFVNLHLFPYGTGYVNALAQNPNEALERDFSGLAMKEGVEMAHRLYGGSIALFAPIAGHLSWYWLTEGDLYVYTPEHANVMILINKSSHISKMQLDTEISGMFELKGVVRRGRDEFAWIYVKRKV